MRTITITELQCRPSVNELTNVVASISWTVADTVTVNGTEYPVSCGGSTQVGDPNPEEFTPYEQLTEQIVATWVETNTDLDGLVAKLGEQIAASVAPSTVTLPTPWSAE